MKYYLFPLLLIFPFAFVNGQSKGNVKNSTNNNHSNSIEKKEVNMPVLESESLEEVEVESKKVKTESIETIQPASATPKALEDVKLDEKDASFSISSQRAGYMMRYNQYTQKRTQKSFTDSQKKSMESVLRNLSAHFPGSFESYFYYYLNGQNDLNRSKALLKANVLKPADQMVQKEMMTYYVLVNKPDETRKALLNLSQSGTYTNSTNTYGQDMINSAPANSTLITHGKEDAYAALYAQKVTRKREDVEILSLDWLTSPQYRMKLKAAGWKLPNTEFIDTDYFAQLCRLNTNKSIAISLTLPKEYLLPILDKLYVSGLVLEYREVPTDMTIRNEELWNTELNKKLIETKDNDLVNNYLPMLYQLKKVYEVNGDADSVKKMDKIIVEIKTR